MIGLLYCAARTVAAVLDIDSPKIGRFSNEDRDILESFVSVIEEDIRWM